MKKETRVKLYILTVGTAAVLVGLLAAWLNPLLPTSSDLWLLPAMTALVALAGRFPFRVSPQGDASLHTIPLFTAALLLPPFGAFLAGTVGILIAERLLKSPLKVTAFNVSNNAVAGGLAGIAFFLLRPESSSLFLTPQLALAAGVAGLILLSTNLLLLFGMITLIKGKAFWKNWKDSWAIDTIQEAAFLSLGMAGALVVDQAGWGLLLLLVPSVLAYYGFKRSVEEARQKAELAEELEQKLKELKETQAQLIQSAKMASVGTLAAGVAHEINNPTFAITGRAEIFLEMLKRSDTAYLHSQMAIADMEAILSQGMRISCITKNLLDYARRSDELVEVRLEEVMDDAVRLLGGKFTSKNVELARDYHQEPRVKVVKNQLEQVFVNLLSNALDATPAQGTITLGCGVDGGVATAYVRDTGVGIPEPVKERLFEPFFTTKGVGKGTGLGMFICHKIITEYQGQIQVESQQGHGTIVTVKLPLVASAVKSEAPAVLLAAGAHQPRSAVVPAVPMGAE